MKSMLIDSTRCIGCRACQVACKEWNSLPAEKTEFFGGPGYQNPARLSSKTWTLITFNNAKTENNDYSWIFSKLQCFHCIEPACVSICPASALLKQENGAVVYDPGKCLGCRHCQLVCPFDIPCFDWNKKAPEIRKCNFCADRIEAGMEPACSKTCPTDAIVFGERDVVIRRAESRIAGSPGKYINHIYGRSEVGGTCVLHLSGVPFADLGFNTRLPDTPISERIKPAMESIPYAMSGLGVALGGLSWIIGRRAKIMESQNSKGGE